MKIEVVVKKNGKTLDRFAVIAQLAKEVKDGENHPYYPGHLHASVTRITEVQKWGVDGFLSMIAEKLGSEFVTKRVRWLPLSKGKQTLWGATGLKFGPWFAKDQVVQTKDDWSGEGRVRLHRSENQSAWMLDRTETYPSNSVSYYERFTQLRDYHIVDYDDDTIYIVIPWQE